MRVLLDTNVWRYIVDTGNQDALYKIARHSNVDVVVSPSIAIETLRLGDFSLRKKIIEVLTRDCWSRLMPDAYLECDEVKREIIRIHPEWQSPMKNTALYRRLRYDWVRAKGGFWEKVRINTNSTAQRYHAKDGSTLKEVQQQAREIRVSALERGEKMMSTKSLSEVTGSWKTLDGETVAVDGWRVYALTVWQNMLAQTDSAFRQWLGCEIDIDLLLTFYALDFTKFWQHEARAEEVRRAWLRAAIYVLQSERKVTDGNPTDSAIAVHLVDVDVFASADKNFVAMARKIRDEAPFRTARGVLVGAGKDGVAELFQMMSERFPSRADAGVRY